MRRLTGILEVVTRWLHYVSGVLVVGLMLMTVTHVLGRWLFNTPVPGSVELTEIGMVAIVFLGLGYAQVRDDHIRVDILYERLGERAKAVVRLFVAVLTIAVLAVLAWRLYDYVGVLEASGRETSALGIPLSPVGLIAVAGTVIYALGVIVTTVRGGGGGPAPGSPADER